MKSILVTGATGFLGRHLTARLKQIGTEARLRLLARGKTPWDGDPSIQIVRGDITSAEDVQRAAEGAEEIYHLAGVVSRSPAKNRFLYETHDVGVEAQSFLLVVNINAGHFDFHCCIPPVTSVWCDSSKSDHP